VSFLLFLIYDDGLISWWDMDNIVDGVVKDYMGTQDCVMKKVSKTNLISKSLDNHITKKDITAIVAASTKIDIPDSSQPQKRI